MRGAFTRTISQYGSVAVGVIKLLILYRLVDQPYFGIIAYASANVAVMSIFRLELRPVVISAPEGGNPARLAAQYSLEIASTLVGLLLAGAAYLLLPWLFPPSHWLAIFALLLVGPVGLAPALFSTPMYLLERELRYDVTSKLMLLGAVLGMLASVALAWAGQPLLALLAGTAFLTLTPGVGSWIVTRWRPVWAWDGAIAREVWAFGVTLWSIGVLGIITFMFDDWLVGTIRGDIEVGYYSQAYMLAKIPLDVFGGVVAGVSMPLYTHSFAAGKAVLARAYTLTTWILARVIVLSSIVMLAATEEIVVLVTGSEVWLPMAPLIRLMFLYILGRPLFQNHAILLLALRRERPYRKMVLVQAAILLAAGPWAVLNWGAAGAAVVVSVMMLVGLVISEIYVTRLIGVTAVPIYGFPILLGTVFTFVLYYSGEALGLPLFLSLALKTVVAGFVFGGLALLFERERLTEVFGLVREHLNPFNKQKEPES